MMHGQKNIKNIRVTEVLITRPHRFARIHYLSCTALI